MWLQSDWSHVKEEVKRLQARIAKATPILELLGATLCGAAEWLEPCAGKLACTVLRGEHAGNGVFLPDVRHEVAYVIVSPAQKVGDETGRSVGRSLPVHASLATVSCEATGTKCRAFGPRRAPRGERRHLRAPMRVGCQAQWYGQ